MLLSNLTSAQKVVSGLVTDREDQALIGVSIQIEGTFSGTVTDYDGRYSLEVPNDDSRLIFSYTGMQTDTVSVAGMQILDIVMQEYSELLDVVVVTSHGFVEREDELGYSSSTVSANTVNKAAETSLINSLSGKASGVRITRNSGDPGAGAYIQIRGISTIDRDAQPLIVVDGIPISNDSRGAQQNYAAQSRLNDINPNDIESITVLKGASAAALWGTRALGGVIVITTKSGKYNHKLSVNYRTTFSFDEISRTYPIQTTFGQGDNGLYDPRSRDSWGDKIADRAGGLDVLDTNGEFFIDQDGRAYYPVLQKNSREIFVDNNFDQIFQNGHFWENNISVNGGNERSTIFASLSHFDQEGIIRASDYQRTTARLNVSHLLNDQVKLKASTAYTRSRSNRILRGVSSSGLALGLLRTPPDFDNSGYRGSYYTNDASAPIANRQRSYREPFGADATATYNNPLWTINEQESVADVDRFISSLELTVSPTSWMDLIGRVGLDKFVEWQQQFFTPGAASGAYTTGYFSKELARNTIFNMDYIARAGHRFNRSIEGTLLVGFNYNHRQRITDGSEIINFIQFADVAGGIRDIDNALPENRSVSSTFGQERTVGVYSSASLSWNDMLFLNGTIRGESASTFGDEGDNTFYFPSASLAWQFTKVSGLKSDILTFGKLRASYGEVGVQPARYNTTNTYTTPSYSDQYGGTLAGSLYGNGAFVPSTQRGNAFLRPERKKETELGVDLRFMKNRLSLSGTWYKNKTEDVLLDFPIANSRGITRLYTNGAEIQNQGIEIDLGYNLIRHSDFNWDVNLMYSQVRNEVTKLDEGLSINLGGLSAVNARAIQGQPIGVLWGSRILRDESGAIIYDENGFPEQDELEGIIGNPNPDWQGAASTSISYKNLTLSVLFETFQGADIYAGTKSVLYALGTWGPSATESTANQNLLDFEGNVIQAGTTFRGDVHNFGAGPVALTEAWYNADGGFFGSGNDELYIEDGSWTRLREASLSYRLGEGKLHKILGIQNVEITLTGRNLLLWTAFEGNDPDTNLEGISVARGIDYFNNPGTKSYVVTLSVTF